MDEANTANRRIPRADKTGPGGLRVGAGSGGFHRRVPAGKAAGRGWSIVREPVPRRGSAIHPWAGSGLAVTARLHTGRLGGARWPPPGNGHRTRGGRRHQDPTDPPPGGVPGRPVVARCVTGPGQVTFVQRQQAGSDRGNGFESDRARAQHSTGGKSFSGSQAGAPAQEISSSYRPGARLAASAEASHSRIRVTSGTGISRVSKPAR